MSVRRQTMNAGALAPAVPSRVTMRSRPMTPLARQGQMRTPSVAVQRQAIIAQKYPGLAPGVDPGGRYVSTPQAPEGKGKPAGINLGAQPRRPISAISGALPQARRGSPFSRARGG